MGYYIRSAARNKFARRDGSPPRRRGAQGQDVRFGFRTQDVLPLVRSRTKICAALRYLLSRSERVCRPHAC